MSMVKKIAALMLLCALLLPAAGLGERGVEYVEGARCFPDEENWTYRFEYRYPHLIALNDSDAAAFMVNETMDTVMREMLELVIPMFAHSDVMTEDGQVIVRQTYEVTALTERIFSVLMTRREERDGEEHVTLEGTTFDVGGEYAGEMLTLRGLVRVADSSDQLGRAVLPVLWEKYRALEAEGEVLAVTDEEAFLDAAAPTMDFVADGEENAVFFFQPSLFQGEYRGPRTVTLTPAELEALAEGVPAEDNEY